jgi:hypothetical protein
MNNNVKRFLVYLIYVTAFGFFVVKADDYYLYLKNIFIYGPTYGVTYFWIFVSIFPIIVGFLMALPQFITTFKQKGSWVVDWIMLLPVGLPSFFVAITPAIYMSGFAPNCQLGGLIMNHSHLSTVAGILFGFVLIASLFKKNLNNV